MFKALRTIFPLVVACAFSAPLLAQSDYPSKPVRIIVPAGAGGAADLLARALADHMGASLKTSFVIDNKGGAGGIIGADAVAKAAPDGYTVLLTSNTLVISPSLYKVPYSVQKDFSAVGLVASAPNVLLASPSIGAKNLSEVIALEKKSPGQLSFGSPAVGSAAHLTVEMLNRATGMQMLHVPFKGPQQAMMETLAGRVPLTISGLSNALPYVSNGKLVPLAVTGKVRSGLAPSIPTFSELGIVGTDVALWFGLFAPAGTPPSVIQKLNQHLNQALNAPAVIEQLAKLGFDPIGGAPARLAESVRVEEPLFAAAVKAANIKAE